MSEIPEPESGSSMDAIENHYGTGNEYFALWLGKNDPEQALDDAQLAKILHHCDESHARDSARVLDIGCGWGGVMQHLVDHYNVGSVTGLTLSESQVAWVNGKNDSRLSAHLQSWKDHKPEGNYGAIISIGAFEHFAKLGMSSEEKIAAYREFFLKCHSWLDSRGYLSLQTVAYGNSLTEDFDQFISKEIFQETDTPKLHEIAAGCERLFEVVRLRNDRDDYRRTLRMWYTNLKARRDDAVRMKGEEEVKRFERYLRLMAYMFEVGGLDLHRITLRKIDKPKNV